MFIISIQKFINNSNNSYYENGFKNGSYKIFFTKEKLLQYFSNYSIFYCSDDSIFSKKIDLNSDSKFQSFLSSLSFFKDKEKEEKEVTNDEYVFYIIDPDYLDVEKIDETTFINNLDIDDDDNFYETFDLQYNICYTSVSQDYFLRIVCKKVIEEESIYFSETEQYESEKICIPKNIENIINKQFTNDQFIFRLGYEIQDLNYYWKLYQKDTSLLKFSINNNNNKDVDKKDDDKKVDILELAFYILKQYLNDQTYNRNIDFLIELINISIKNKTDYNSIHLNTLFENYSLNDAIKNCCTKKEQKKINSSIFKK